MVSTVLGTGLVAGVLHAFDPDHVVTISTLSAQSDARKTTRSCAMWWALGHGAVLFVTALALLLFRLPLPEGLSSGAERLVGVILLAAGGTLIYAVWHRGMVHSATPPLRQRAPFLVGMVHGLAGSAAVFALLPVGFLGPLAGVAFVLVFSLGVLGGMLLFGSGYERVQNLIGRRSARAGTWSRGLLGTLALAMGGYWLMAA